MWIYFLISIFWIETKYEDFIDGKISDGLYVSKGIYQEQDSGCIEFVKRFDINNDGYFDLTSADEAGPYIRIWLGSSSGYSPTNRIYLPRDRGGGVFIADLNLDTYPELIHSGHELSYATIFWGSPSGPSPGNYTTLYAGKCEAIYCDDINKDGWLDIILPGRDPTGIWIYYGSRNGYSNYLYIPFGEWIEHNVEIADLNKDGWKDMIFILSESGRGMIIYWGPNNTYRMEILPISLTSTHGLSVADLDKNGWLDLVISAYRYSIQSAILWGSSNGFDSIPPTIITTGYSSGGSAAWDFNKDNLLDIIFFRISYQKPKIYYNTGTYPYFNDTNSQEITPLTFWATGGFVGDFNFDGDIDIWLNNRADYSYVIWGPNWTNYTSLPVSSDLHGSFMEIGNTYNRAFYEEYISSIFYLGPDSVINGGTVSWIADEPQGSKCEVYLRSGNSSQIDTSWTDWVYIQNSGDSIPQNLFDKHYLQYKIIFSYLKPTYVPKLEEISFNILTSPPSLLNIFPDTSSYVHPKDSVIYKVKAVYTGETNELVYLFTSNTHPGWFVKLTDTLGNLIDTILLIPNDTFDFNLKIYSPEYPSPFECDTTYIKGYLISNPLKRDSARIITKITGNISLKIEPDTESVTVPGVTIPYPLRVINTGEFKDSILLSYTNSSSGYISYITDSTGSQIINFVKTFPKDTVKIILWVTPLPATPDSQNLTKVIARSSWINSIYDSALVMTYLYHMPYLLVEPDTFSYGNPGDNLKYRLRVINNQESIDTINLSFHHNQNWNARITDTLGNLINKIYVPAKDTGFIIFEISIPENSPGGIRDTAFIKGVSNNLSISDSARIITEVKVSAAVYIEPDQQKEGAPGEKIRYYLKVINSGNSQDIINVYVLQSNWAERIIYDSLTNMPLNDNNNDGYQDVILAPLAFQKIYVNVDIPQNASSQDNDLAIIRASSTNNPSVWDNANLFTQVKKVFYSIILEPDTEISIPYNSSFLINLYSLFQGNSNDYIELEYSFSGANLNIELRDSQGLNPLIDNNQNGNIDLGVCEPSNKNYFSIYLRAPEFNYSISDTEDICIIRLKGYLYSYNTLYDSAKIKINLIPPLYIFNYESPFDSKRGTNFFISVPEDGKGNLEVYSRLGEKIITLFKNKPLKRGKHIIYWNGKNEKGNYVAPGVYIYVFEFKGEKIKKTITKKTSVKR